MSRALSMLVAGERIGPYRVVRRLGSGGMGTVFLCEAAEPCAVPPGRPVAVKVLRAGNDEEERRRFVREARYLQSLQHPGIVRLLDIGEHLGHPYLVMAYVAGSPVDELLRTGGGRVDERRAAAIAAQALEALHVAHLGGILHRDLKPGNLVIDGDGRVKVLDFGLAAGPMGESRLTDTGEVLGTPVYMSPEQAAGLRDAVSPRSDLYSMGACLYELLTGQAPFEADNSMAVLRRIIDDPLVPPSRLRPGMSRELETVLLVAMAKDPRDRYPSARAMALDLRRFLGGRRVLARRPGPLRRLWRAVERNRSTVAAVGLLAFLLVSVAGLAVRRAVRQRAATPDPHAWIAVRDYQGGDLLFAPAPTLGPDLELASLPAIEGAVRLRAVIGLAEQAPEGPALELLLSDPDIGRGYRLRLELAPAGAATGGRLRLLRQERLMASRELPPLPRGGRVSVRLEHADTDLRAAVGVEGSDQPPAQLHFLDLVPVQGPSASGVYLVRRPGAAEVLSAAVERQRGGEYVSALALADDRRLEGNLARAAALYEDFIARHPGSPQAADARLRLAVCQAAMPNTLAQAYDGFLAAAANPGAEPAYVMVATFHAWVCALRLNRYEDAEALFDTIRAAYDLPTLAAAVPEQTLRQVRDDYFSRAERLEQDDAERAVRLYLTGAEIAGFLDGQRLGLGLANAADLLVGLGRYGVALETYRRLADDGRLPGEVQRRGMLGVAEAQRLLGDLDAADLAYARAAEAPGATRAETAWARLWQGDLWCQRGRIDRAVELWSAGAAGAGNGPDELPERMMRALVAMDRSIPPASGRPYANDIDYCNGRIAWLKGDRDGASAWLQRAAGGHRPQDWPAALARDLLASGGWGP